MLERYGLLRHKKPARDFTRDASSSLDQYLYGGRPPPVDWSGLVLKVSGAAPILRGRQPFRSYLDLSFLMRNFSLRWNSTM